MQPLTESKKKNRRFVATEFVTTCDEIVIDDLWRERGRSEKFRFHNAQWLEIVGGNGGANESTEVPLQPNGNDDYLGGDEELVSTPIFDEDFDHFVHEDSDEAFEEHDIAMHFM